MFDYFLLTIPEEDRGFLQNLWLSFYENYIDPSETFDNLNMDSGSILSIRIVIIGLFFGLALAGFAAVFNKRVLGALVRKLIADECLSPETAKTLDELGFDNIFMRFAVKHSTSLRRVVKCREEEIYDREQERSRLEYEENRKQNKKLSRFREKPYKINDLTDAFYIPEKMKFTADVKFEKKGNSWFSTIVSAIAMIIIMIAILIALPHILSAINEITGNMNTPKI